MGQISEASSKLFPTIISHLFFPFLNSYLVKNFNLDEKRFVTVGQGSSKPVADNQTEDGRALNRRTDIKVVLNAN